MTTPVKRPFVDIRDLWARALSERVSAVEAEVNRRMSEARERTAVEENDEATSK